MDTTPTFSESKTIARLRDAIRFLDRTSPGIRRHMAIAVFAGLSDVFFNLTLAYVLKELYAAVNAENPGMLWNTVWFFTLSLAGTFAYNCACWRMYGNSNARITGDIRRAMYSALCSGSMADAAGMKNGETMSVFTSDLNAAQGIHQNMRLLVCGTMLGTVSSIIVFRTSAALGAFILSLAFVQLIINLCVVGPMEARSRAIREHMGEVNEAYSNMLRNNMAIRLHCPEDFHVKVMNAVNDNLYRARMGFHTVNTAVGGANVFFGLIGYIAVLSVGGMLVGSGRLAIPDLLFVAQLRYMMVQGVLVFGNLAVSMQPSIVGIRKIMGLVGGFGEGSGTGSGGKLSNR